MGQSDKSDDPDHEDSTNEEEKSISRRRQRESRSQKHKDDQKKKSKKKRRKRSRSPSDNDISAGVSDDGGRKDSRKKRKQVDDLSFSSSSGDFSDSSSEGRRSKKKKKSRHKESSKKKKKDKKKKHKHLKKSDEGVPIFGKYGVLKASDFHKKQRSFTVWLEEVKGIMSFNGPKWELQNYFKDYMEDFNTGTLPHIKYYDYDKWELEEYTKNKASTSTASQKSSAQRDEVLHMLKLQEQAKAKRQDELDLVRNMMSKDKREEMKYKAELQAQMAHAYKIGDQETYRRLKARLEPEK